MKILKGRQATHFTFTDKERDTLIEYFNGDRGARTTGQILGKSHQTVINLTGMIVRELTRRKKLDAKKIMQMYANL